MSSEIVFLLRPRDPLMVRDGRPFNAEAGAYARSLSWPMPSTLAGAIRTHLGGKLGFDWRNGGPEEALKIEVQGPILAVSEDGVSWQPYLPAPKDAIIFKPKGKGKTDNGGNTMVRLSPCSSLTNGAGCNLPEGVLPLTALGETGGKPDNSRVFWSLDDTVSWLLGEDNIPQKWMPELPKEARIHVKIDPEKRTSEEGKLFSTLSVCFSDCSIGGDDSRAKSACTAIICRAASFEHDVTNCGRVVPFGGERRVSMIEMDGASWPQLPDELLKGLVGQKQIKLQMVTPGIFKEGWKPGWAGGTPSIDGLSGVTFKLMSAAVDRRVVVSGWDYRYKHKNNTNNNERRGPKPARWCVPAGSVYFFETNKPLDESHVRSLWFASVSDGEQDRRDGFGIVVPGKWDYGKQ